MTAILGLRKELSGGMYTIFAADSLVVRNTDKVILSNNHKYVQYENFTALYSGSASVLGVLEDFKDILTLRSRKCMKMRGRLDVHDFYSQVKKRLKTKLDELSCVEDDAEEFQLILVTPHKIYLADSSFIQESDKYIASGSAETYVLPVVVSQYDKVKTKEELRHLAYTAIETSIKLSTLVDYPIIVKEL